MHRRGKHRAAGQRRVPCSSQEGGTTHEDHAAAGHVAARVRRRAGGVAVAGGRLGVHGQGQQRGEENRQGMVAAAVGRHVDGLYCTAPGRVSPGNRGVCDQAAGPQPRGRPPGGGWGAVAVAGEELVGSGRRRCGMGSSALMQGICTVHTRASGQHWRRVPVPRGSRHLGRRRGGWGGLVHARTLGTSRGTSTAAAPGGNGPAPSQPGTCPPTRPGAGPGAPERAGTRSQTLPEVISAL